MEKGKQEESLVNILKIAPGQELQAQTVLEGCGCPAVCLKHSQECLNRLQSCLVYPFLTCVVLCYYLSLSQYVELKWF